MSKAYDKSEVLLEVKGLKKYFSLGKKLFSKHEKQLKAVDDVSFYIRRGETLGLVGESGCGKSTTGRTILKLYEPTGGQILFNGVDITNYSQKEMLPYRKRMQMIFQDPYASLNTRMTVTDIIGEGIDTHHLYKGKDRQDRIYELLEDLQDEMGLTYLFIAHDLSMVKHISDRIGVMYLGQLAEVCESNELYQNPLHPYTQALLSAIPIPDPRITRKNKRIVLQGDVTSPIDPKDNCRFAGRCPKCKAICREQAPEMREVSPGHFVACHFV